MIYQHIDGLDKPLARVIQGTIMLSRDRLEEGFELLDGVFEQGGTTFDTAHGYGGGDADRVLGLWMEARGNRDRVVIVGKGCHHNVDRRRVTPYDLASDLMDTLARLPLLGQWYSETDTAKWAMVMSAMLTSRVELVGALALASRGVRVSRRRAMLDRALAAVRGGQPLSAALETENALTATGYNLIRVGEQSGQLPEMMRSLATLYEENSSRRMKRVLTLIEPVAILCIGAFIGIIFIGVILAITAVNNVPL